MNCKYMMNRFNLSGWCLLLVALAISGCNEYSTPTTNGPGDDVKVVKQGKDKTAQQVLTEMAKRYRTAKTYQDAGTVTLKYQQNGQQVNRSYDFAVACERPNKLKIDAYGVVLRIDGKKFHAAIKDVEELANQVLELDAPAELTLESALFDGSIMRALGEGIGEAPPQVVLLLDDGALEKIQNKQTPTFLPKQAYEDHACYRVRINSEVGPLTIWIDEQTLVVRRIDFPTFAVQKGLEQNGAVERLEIFADFAGARFDAPVPEQAFQFEVPDGALLVKRLLGPAPSPPTPLLGKELPEFSFTDLDGKKVTRDSIKDKIAIFDFWFADCTPCQQSFPLMNQAYQKYKGSDKVVFLAVNGDPDSLSDKTVRDTMKRWGSEIPAVRDPQQNIKSVFRTDSMPTMFIVGSDGTVQYHELGVNPNIATELPAVIEQLLSGKSIAEETRKRFDDRLADFKRAQQSPPEVRPTNGEKIEIPKGTIAPASSPTSHRLTKLWTASALKAPGNSLVIPGANGAEAKIVVFDGWETVVELSADGKQIAEHKLVLPAKDSIVAMLRTAVDGQGKRYYALFFSGQQQVFLYDDAWKQILAFPAADSGRHEGLGDVQLVDLDGNGTLELAIGYYGDVGLQLVSFDGKRLWNDRNVQWVTRMATSQPDAENNRKLLCANSRGEIAVFDHAGKAGTAINVPGRPLQSIFAAHGSEPGNVRFCGVTGPLGVNTLVGFDQLGKELWTFDLPKGVHLMPIEAVSSAMFFQSQNAAAQVAMSGQWLAAGADGSVNILSADGKLLDRFNTGSKLTGLTGAVIAGDNVLLISTEKSFDAWKIEPMNN